MKKKLCSPFILSPQRHLFELLALPDIKNVVVKPTQWIVLPHPVSMSIQPLTSAQGWRAMSLVIPRRHGWGSGVENKQQMVHREEEEADLGWLYPAPRKTHSSPPGFVHIPSLCPKSPPTAFWDTFSVFSTHLYHLDVCSNSPPKSSCSVQSVAKLPTCHSKPAAPHKVSQGHDGSFSVTGPSASQLSTARHRNGTGTVQFPPTKNDALRESPHPWVHIKLAYLNAINSSDMKDAPHMAIA